MTNEFVTPYAATKRDKVPVIPFLSLSSGGRAKRREGQKGRLGELRVAEGTKRRSVAPPGGSGGWMETEAPEAELEDGAAGRQHAVEGIQPSYSELTALPPASPPSAASPLRPPEKTKPRQEELVGPERSPRWPSPRARVMTASRAKLEDEAPEHQHAVEEDAYSDFAALPPALFLFRSLPTPAAQGDDTGEFTEPATRMMGSPVPHGAATGAYSDPSS